VNCAVSGMNMRAKGRKRNDNKKRKDSKSASDSASTSCNILRFRPY
jgi:hypothetical protein